MKDNTLAIKIKLEGFEEVKKQLDILIGKCKELNNNCNIDDITKEISEKLKLCVIKND